MSDDNTKRAAFEGAMRNRYPVACESTALLRVDMPGSIRLGEYCMHDTQLAWELWQDCMDYAGKLHADLLAEVVRLRGIAREAADAATKHQADVLRLRAAEVDAERLRAALQAIVDLDDGDSPDLWHFDAEFAAAREAIDAARSKP